VAVAVADTSALISLSCAHTDLFGVVVREYELLVPREVVDELKETASYDDEQARAAEKALEFVGSEIEVCEAELDAGFPLDRGENAAVALANSEDADLFLCDEFNSIGLVHASLTDVRLVTTPKLLEVFVHRGNISQEEAVETLDRISKLRSWENNSYVERVRDILEG